MSDDPELTWVSSRWKILLEAGAWITALVGGFLLLPPYLDPGKAAAFTKFGQFLASSLAGLLLFPLSVWAKSRYMKWWWLLSVLLLAASLWAFFRYNELIGRDTVPYGDSRVVAGSESQYTQSTQRYVESVRQQNRPATREDVIMDFAGATRDIWPEAVLQLNEDRLARSYFLALGLFASFVVVLAHVVVTGIPLMAKGRKGNGL